MSLKNFHKHVPARGLMLWQWSSRVALLAGAFVLMSCSEAAVLRQQLDDTNRRLARLIEHSRAGWRQALCNRETRLLMSAVQRECENGSCDKENPSAEVISAQVCNLDPKRRERFLEILIEQEREVFYLYSNSKTLSDESRRRLTSLVLGNRPLPTTRFLVVTRPWDKEPDKYGHAERRGRVVQSTIVELLLGHYRGELSPEEQAQRGLSATDVRRQRTLLWPYAFPLRANMKVRPATGGLLPPAGKPFEAWANATNTDAPPDDERGVWVFRLDC